MVSSAVFGKGVCGCWVKRLDVSHVRPVPAQAAATVGASVVLECPSVTPRHSLARLTLPLPRARHSQALSSPAAPEALRGRGPRAGSFWRDVWAGRFVIPVEQATPPDPT